MKITGQDKLTLRANMLEAAERLDAAIGAVATSDTDFKKAKVSLAILSKAESRLDRPLAFSKFVKDEKAEAQKEVAALERELTVARAKLATLQFLEGLGSK